MQEIIDGGAVPDVEVFAADLAPVCAATESGDDDSPLGALVVAKRRRKMSAHRALLSPLALAHHSRFALLACRAYVPAPVSAPQLRGALQVSGVAVRAVARPQRSRALHARLEP
jgi:hypothetical protein